MNLQIHSLDSFGTHDGPGIRLVVFLQGCNLACSYCHNPDTMCNIGGNSIPNKDIIDRAIRMKPYFNDGGGVTFSGGEPLVQAAELLEIIDELHSSSIHVAIDTNATIITESSQIILKDKADLVLFDIKATNPKIFKTITGVSAFDNMLQNISIREKAAKPYWFRYVLIPGITDFDEHLKWIITTFKNNKFIEQIEILPYHTMGIHKWEALGKDYPLKKVRENTSEELQKVEKVLGKYFKVSVR